MISSAFQAVRGVSHHNRRQLYNFASRAAATNSNSYPQISSPAQRPLSFGTTRLLTALSSKSPKSCLTHQSIRMVSNSANAPFAPEKLWDLKGRVTLITGKTPPCRYYLQTNYLFTNIRIICRRWIGHWLDGYPGARRQWC